MGREFVTVDLESRRPQCWKGDLVLVGVTEGDGPQPALDRLGRGVAAEVARAMDAGWFRGKPREKLMLVLPPKKGRGFKRLGLVGLGKAGSLAAEGWRELGGSLLSWCREQHAGRVLCLLARDRCGDWKRLPILESLAEGLLLADYRFDRFRRDPDREGKGGGDGKKGGKKGGKKAKGSRVVLRFELAVRDRERQAAARSLARVREIVAGVTLARDLGNLPGNRLVPETLAARGRKLAREYPIRTRVWGPEKLAKKGMNGLLAVGQGSANPPRLVILEYRQGGKKPPLVVIGKAITFDSGGISLKPGAGMEEMKFDMCGGAAVLGLMRAVAGLGLPINLVGLVPAAENLPSGTAQRPGDIIRLGKGIDVEVINTDAEGRLVLADALHYAESFKPSAIIDLATLTGACVIALGNHASGLMGNDARLLRRLRRAGEATGERLWELPMFAEYQEQLKSPVADLRNVGGRSAGAITAACFLSRFVSPKRPWAHLDIAGTAWDLSGRRPHVPKGAVGIGVRLLCHLVAGRGR
ncbi:MAG: leucyl aminopeptidase [Magnetococcales bacterium]|nr:leucyl aminopeptidase [Magnetococcales bacterium]